MDDVRYGRTKPFSFLFDGSISYQSRKTSVTFNILGMFWTHGEGRGGGEKKKKKRSGNCYTPDPLPVRSSVQPTGRPTGRTSSYLSRPSPSHTSCLSPSLLLGSGPHMPTTYLSFRFSSKLPSAAAWGITNKQVSSPLTRVTQYTTAILTYLPTYHCGGSRSDFTNYRCHLALGHS